MTWPPGNMQYIGMRHGSHTNWSENIFCILPYLNISDFLCLKVLFPVHYPTRDLLRMLGLLKQGVTIFIVGEICNRTIRRLEA